MTPALLISTSSRSMRPSSSSVEARTASRPARSRWWNAVSPPISSTTALALLVVAPAEHTRAPVWASARAVSLPNPLVAPVMTIVFPDRSSPADDLVGRRVHVECHPRTLLSPRHGLPWTRQVRGSGIRPLGNAARGPGVREGLARDRHELPVVARRVQGELDARHRCELFRTWLFAWMVRAEGAQARAAGADDELADAAAAVGAPLAPVARSARSCGRAR